MDIQADMVYSHTGYDVIFYFQSEVIVKKTQKYLRQLLVEFLKNVLSNDHEILHTCRG